MKWFDRIIERIASIPSDKWAHGVVSMVMVMALSRFSIFDTPTNILVAYCITLSAGLLKEVYDEAYRYGFDFEDLVADCVGATVGLILYLL